MISPLSKIFLQCIAKVLEEKNTLVRISEHLYDAQFLNVLGFAGFPTNTRIINDEMDYLENLELIAKVDKTDNYIGKSIHYILTKEGCKAIRMDVK
jgi:hypothetical protein